MNVKTIKSYFPIFANNSSLVYLDNAATTQKPQSVIDAVSHFYAHDNANVHRGIYESGESATSLYEQVREKIAKFINATDLSATDPSATDPSEIIFTSGTTEGINFVADTWGRAHLKSGDEIVLTQAEHHSNLLPWQRLAKRTGAVLRFIEIDTETYLPINPESVITEKTKFVAVAHVSNVLGHIWQEGQLESLIKKAHSVGAKVLVDAAQSAPHQKIDVQELGADFLVFSGHKMCASTGIGILYIKKELHDEVEPYQLGGSMVHSATFYDATSKEAPQKFEAGTPAIAQVIGFGAAIDFLNEHIDFELLAKHEQELCKQMYDGLQDISGVKVLGNRELMTIHGHLASFAVQGLHAHDIAALLANKDIAVRAGHHCAQPLAQVLGIESSVRASLYFYNTQEDIETFLMELKDVIRELS